MKKSLCHALIRLLLSIVLSKQLDVTVCQRVSTYSRRRVNHTLYIPLTMKGNSNQKVTPGSDGEEDLCEVHKQDAHLLVHCERCLVWHCLDCAKLTEEVMDFLEGYNSLHWFCNLCNPTMTKTIQACKPSLDTAIETETSSETIHSLMKKTVDSSVNQLNSMMEEAKEQFKQFLK